MSFTKNTRFFLTNVCSMSASEAYKKRQAT